MVWIEHKMFCVYLIVLLTTIRNSVLCEVEEYIDDGYFSQSIPEYWPIQDPLNVTILDVINIKVNTIEEHAFSKYKNLKVLRLEGNIDHIEDNAFEDLKSLKELSLNNNNIDNIDSKIFTSLEHLTSLNLNKNKIDTIRLYDMKNLQEISLNNNSLDELSDENFENLPSLKILRVSFNRISTISVNTFDSCPSLTRLYLDHNELASLEEQMFYYLRNLEFLYLDHNHLTSLNGKHFQGLQHLESLSISYNLIADIASDTFRKLTNLVHLHLSNNKIKVLHSSLLKDLNYLSGFWVDHNEIKYVPSNFFRDTYQLDVINVEHNLLNKFRVNGNVQFSPSYVYLKHNKIITIELSPLVQEKVQFLDLSYNRMSSIDTKSFKHLNHLYELNLSHNEMTDFPMNLPKNLVLLDLSSNEINSTNFISSNDIAGPLETLDLSSNKIMSMDVQFLLTKYPKLNKINLDYNPFSGSFKEDILSSDHHKFINVEESERNWLIIWVPVVAVLLSLIIGAGIFVGRKYYASRKKELNFSWSGYDDVEQKVADLAPQTHMRFELRRIIQPRASMDSNGYTIPY